MSASAPMPLYEGTKRLYAIPMTRGAYNEYRGWTPPAGEDQAEPGYLVEYVDGGKPNDSRHAGYISWSPAGVFEATYKPVNATQAAQARTDDGAIEQEIQAKGLTAPRVTPASLEAEIASEHYFTAAEGVDMADPEMTDAKMPPALRLLTFCVLVLRNGFTVTGESACASPENFDAEVGRKVARQNAVQKMWPLLGYELKTKLAAKGGTPLDRMQAEYTELLERTGKLVAFMTTDAFKQLDPEARALMHDQRDAMDAYREVLDRRIQTFKP